MELPDGKRQVPQGLNGVGVKIHPPLPGDPADFLYGLNRSDLVVGMHDRDKDCFSGNRLPDVVGIDQAISIHGQDRNLETLLLQEMAGLQDGVMLDGGGNDMIPLALPGVGHPFDGRVVALRPAAGEDDLSGRRPQKGGGC